MNKNTFNVLHVGNRFGKTMENARSLAEAARNFTDIEITVRPYPEFELFSEIAKTAHYLLRSHSIDKTCKDCVDTEKNHVEQLLELLESLKRELAVEEVEKST